MESAVVHLQGDLTHTGVTLSSIDSLEVSLQQIESGGEKYICIDCGKIRAADISGLQLLNVWMQCARFMGVEPELVNLSYTLQQALQRMGLGHWSPGNSAHPETPDVTRTVPASGKNPFRAEYSEPFINWGYVS
jgi:anti-anti-sigma regulatory factor